MARNDYERLCQARVRWQKEQQLIRRKYQISYKMTHMFRPCLIQSISLTPQTSLVLKDEQHASSHRTRTAQLDKPQLHIENNESNILPIHCLKCHLNPVKCSCSDGLGDWWCSLQKKYHSTDSQKSSADSPQERHRSFNSSRVVLSPVEQIKSRSSYDKHQYVLLDWNSRSSLLNFLQTRKPSRNLSKMNIEQLQDCIIHQDHISIFHSISELILSIANAQQQPSLCQIFIDPSYYSKEQGISPLSSSKLLADNLDLTRTMHSIENLATLLGVKLSRSLDKFSSEKVITGKQRKSLLNQQALLIASDIPYNICRSISP